MNIVIGSAHRSNVANHKRYFQQVESLRRAAPLDNVRVIAAEGDSTDNTRDSLMRHARKYGLDLELAPCTHGRPHYGSVVDADRMASLSVVGNSIFNSVNRLDDVLIYVESDLVWNGADLVTLAREVFHRATLYDVLSPLVMAGDALYDIWAMRDLDGVPLSPFPPHHQQLYNHDHMELSSTGSCLVMRGDVARTCRIRNDNALVGWSEDARSHGYRIGITKQVTVRHP